MYVDQRISTVLRFVLVLVFIVYEYCFFSDSIPARQQQQAVHPPIHPCVHPSIHLEARGRTKETAVTQWLALSFARIGARDTRGLFYSLVDAERQRRAH